MLLGNVSMTVLCKPPCNDDSLYEYCCSKSVAPLELITLCVSMTPSTIEPLLIFDTISVRDRSGPVTLCVTMNVPAVFS
jgi:hypothetical protein